GAAYARFGVVTTTANNSGWISTRDFKGSAGDIGESSNWNIIEQYRHDGNGWVKVELSHYVFSTVDLGKATVGELDGIRIKANTIGSETLTADAIDGKVITGATIRSAASGARTLMSTSGFEAYDNSGKRTFFA